MGCVALHEALTLAVDEVAALPARTLGDQHALAGDAGRMKLEELHILQRDAGAQHHRHAVAGIDVRIGVGAEQLAAAARGNQGGLGLDDQRLTGFDLQHQCADNGAFQVLQQVDGEELVEEVGAYTDFLLIETMKNGVAGAVRRGTGARRLRAAEVLRHAAERPLVDTAVVQP